MAWNMRSASIPTPERTSPSEVAAATADPRTAWCRLPSSMPEPSGCASIAQVLDQAPAIIAGDHVEGHGLDPEAVQQLRAFRAGDEVEHREQDRAAPQQLVAPLWRPQDHDDVLGERRGLVRDPHPGRGREVFLIGDAHPDPAARLDHHVRVHGGQQADQRRQKGPPFAGLVLHPGEAERQDALALRCHPDSIASLRARRSGHADPGPRGRTADAAACPAGDPARMDAPRWSDLQEAG